MIRILINLMLILNPPPVVVVHVESQFEGAARVAQEISILSENTNDFYLLGSEEWKLYTEIPDVNPDHVIISKDGEHNIKISSNRVIVAGGYFRACYANAVSLLYHNSKGITLIIPMKAVYFGYKRTLYEYYKFNYHGNEEKFKEYIESVAKVNFGIKNPKVKIQNDMVYIK